MSNVRFRLIGINQDNRADGTGKAGLTFQAIGHYNIISAMNTADSNAGGWRDTLLRKNLNYESTGTIWNAIQSTDFKNNITPVLKITNNNANEINTYNTSKASSITADKLYILSPSEMGMPIINNYKNMRGYNYAYTTNAHYYNLDTYKNTIKSSNDGNEYGLWNTSFDYIYAGNAYQWWMLPAGSRKMSNGNQAYHNTDSYSYCALLTSSNPFTFTNKYCNSNIISYWLRSENYVNFIFFSNSGFLNANAGQNKGGVVVSFSF